MGQIYRLPPFSISPASLVDFQVIPWNIGGYGIPELWTQSKGEGVTVAVIDTGVDADHPDLKDKIREAQDFTGSAYGCMDRIGHGTHICGIIAAVDNGIGVIGVAPSATLLVAKAVGDDGSAKASAVAQAIRWATQRSADIISLSLGGPVDSQIIDDALIEAVDAGVIVVCAAGNDGFNHAVCYPAKRSAEIGLIAVAAVGWDVNLAPYSSIGPEVDIAAPGEGILSLAPGGGYATLSGTSQAAPFVSGAIALLLSVAKKSCTRLSPAEIKIELHDSAQDHPDDICSGICGWGLIRPAKLLAEAPKPDPQPAAFLRIDRVCIDGVSGSLVFQPDQ